MTQNRIDLRGWVSENKILLLLALGVALIHAMTNGQYGFHRDELDILINARQLDWGYVAYPPLTPFFARLGLTLFGSSLPGLRLFSAFGQGVVVLLVGWIARDLGGKQPAQILAALAAGTLIQYMSFDYLWWVLLAFFVVRLLATDDPRWWLGVGTAVGLGMMTKYTIVPAYVTLTAGGAVWWQSWLNGRSPAAQRAGWRISWVILALAGVVGFVLVKPVVPINSSLWAITSGVNGEVVEMVSWPDLAEQVAAIYADLPDTQQNRTVILAGNYGEAGALDLYSEVYKLPLVISGSNSLWARGYGSPEPETVIVVGFERQVAERFFKTCDFVGRVSNRFAVNNEETSSHTGMFVCRQPRRPWAEMWPKMQWFQ